MKKLLVVLGCIAVLSSIVLADGWIRQTNGSNYSAATPAETVLTVSSTTYTTEGAVPDHVLRHYQNTGSTNIMYFYVLASSQTAGQKYLVPTGDYIEDQYTGTIYFMVTDGSASSTLSRTTFKKQ